jgi:hypothetical protein
MTLADKIIYYNLNLTLDTPLPEHICVMNPYQDPSVRNVTEAFYRKFYNDSQPRRLIMGINPGRFGAGVTGIPFTDSVRLREKCGIISDAIPETKELSSVFVYEVIKAYGGTEAFYGDFYINSVCPLGFTKRNERGKEVNYNYYDSPQLIEAVYEYIVNNIVTLLKMGFEKDVCFCLGTGKNVQFLRKLNEKYCFFDQIIPLEHPRFVMQYKLKQIADYVDMYIKKLSLE